MDDEIIYLTTVDNSDNRDDNRRVLRPRRSIRYFESESDEDLETPQIVPETLTAQEVQPEEPLPEVPIQGVDDGYESPTEEIPELPEIESTDTFDDDDDPFGFAALIESGFVVRVIEGGFEISQAQSVNNNVLENEIATDEEEDDHQSIEEKFTCKICYSKAVSIGLIPCGHLMCSSCARRLQESTCPFCRSTIQRKQKLFF